MLILIFICYDIVCFINLILWWLIFIKYRKYFFYCICIIYINSFEKIEINNKMLVIVILFLFLFIVYFEINIYLFFINVWIIFMCLWIFYIKNKCRENICFNIIWEENNNLWYLIWVVKLLVSKIIYFNVF